ncbi:MAG: autotransporter-associated beta strand repeat-containing protein, partial [bacterium]
MYRGFSPAIGVAAVRLGSSEGGGGSTGGNGGNSAFATLTADGGGGGGQRYGTGVGGDVGSGGGGGAGGGGPGVTTNPSQGNNGGSALASRWGCAGGGGAGGVGADGVGDTGGNGGVGLQYSQFAGVAGSPAGWFAGGGGGGTWYTGGGSGGSGGGGAGEGHDAIANTGGGGGGDNGPGGAGGSGIVIVRYETPAAGNTYTGGTTVTEGVIKFSSGALGSSGDIALKGGTLQYATGNTEDISSRIKNSTGAVSIDTNSNNVTFASAIDATNVAGLTKLGAGALTLSGVNTYSGKTTAVAGTLSINAETALGSDPVVFTADQLTLNGGTLATPGTFSIDDSNRGITIGSSSGTFDVAGSAILTVSNVIAGTGNLTKAGSGTLALSGVKAYSGGTTIDQGTLVAENSDALGTGSMTLNAAGTLDASTIPDLDLKIAGDWDNRGGTFNTGTGGATVEFVDASKDSTLYGSTVFNNLKCVVAGKTLIFSKDTTQTVNGSITLGPDSGVLYLKAGDSGTENPKLYYTGLVENEHIKNVDVRNIDSGTSPDQATLYAAPTSILTNTQNWELLFTGYTISGLASGLTSGIAMVLAVTSGGTQKIYSTTTTDGSGSFSFGSVTLTGNEYLLIYADDSACKANLVGIVPSTPGDISGLLLCDGRFSIGNSTSGAVGTSFANSDLGSAYLIGNTNVYYSVDGSNNVTFANSLGTAIDVWVPSGIAYTPGSDVIAPGSVLIEGALTAPTAMTVGGDWTNNGGTFTHGGGDQAVTFTGTGKEITSAATETLNHFNHVTLD